MVQKTNVPNTRPIRLGVAEQVPKQYAKPLRKTAYLHTYPHVINGGILYKEHEYPGLFQFNHRQDRQLLRLFEDNEVSFTRDRQKDARSFGWIGTGRTKNYLTEGGGYSNIQPPIDIPVLPSQPMR